MKLGLALLASALCCLAQQPYEIRGSVSEPNVGPLSGIEVRLFQLNKDQSPDRSVATTYTDSRGEYMVRLDQAGSYLIQIFGPGYTFASTPTISVSVDPAHPRAESNASLVRLGQIIGRVLDADTLKPIPGVTLLPMRRNGSPQTTYRWLPASQILPPGTRDEDMPNLRQGAKSGEDGNFTLRDRMPGDYSVTTLADGQMTENGMLAEPFLLGGTADDLKVNEEVYRPLYWPGGVPASEAVPLTLTSGGSVNVGNILLKKTPAYRALIHVPPGDCPGGESVRLTLSTKGDAKTQVVPCGSDVLIKGLFPGNYYLYAVSDWQGERDNVEHAVWGQAMLLVRDKNLSMVLGLKHGVVLDVHLTAAQGGPAIPESVKFSTQPEPLGVGLPYPNYEQFLESQENGRFRMAVGPGLQRLIPNGLRDSYVSEVRYNGATFRDFKIAFNASAPNHTLEVILDNKFATVQGEVAGAAGAVTVLFQPDFLPTSVLSTGAYSQLYTATATGGRYISNPLPPGTYRVMALPSERLLIVDGVPLMVPNDAPRITLRPGANETLNVRLTPASR